MTDIYDFLDKNNITYQRFDHPAVFTCEESEKLCPEMPGKSTKNLFLQNQSKTAKKFFLVTVGHDKKVDLKKMGDMLGHKLSFASSEEMMNCLEVEPGAVTLLGIINDGEKAVEVIIDEKLWGESLQCHPLVNTATLIISSEDINKFLVQVGHTPKIISIPEKNT